MGSQTIIFIVLGTIMMLVVAFILKKDYELSPLKTVLISVSLTVVGVLSVMLMYFVENGKIGGVSFFGAVFFVPLLLYPVSLLLKMPYKEYLDISAPMVAIMLTVMKINCLIAGCCYGKVLYYDTESNPVRFPCQLSEMLVALIIALILIICIKGKLLKSLIYPSFMVLYGVTRFILNFLRETNDFIFGLAIGNIWAIVATIIGVAWIALFYFFQRKKKNS